MKRISIAVMCALLMIAVHGHTAIIDHHDAGSVEDLPLATMAAVGDQQWYFMHASVGSNMVNGMASLADTDPERYRLARTVVDDYEPPPADPEEGVVFDNHRGNPGWEEKLTMFEDAVRELGWRHPSVTIVLNKLCYDDWRADPQVYLASMADLENEFPGTVFVYATMPISIGADSRNVARNQYNDVVRAHCAANDLLLFDIADIEAHDPEGNLATFTYEGETYPALYSGYTSDGGHLNQLGAEQVARGWYATAAAVVGQPTPVSDLPGAGVAIQGVFPNPFNPQVTIRLQSERPQPVEVTVCDVGGRLVARLFSGVLQPGVRDLEWRGIDDAGHGVGSGVYLVNVRGEAGISTRRMTLMR